jgi:hypothetical protein
LRDIVNTDIRREKQIPLSPPVVKPRNENFGVFCFILVPYFIEN